MGAPELSVSSSEGEKKEYILLESKNIEDVPNTKASTTRPCFSGALSHVFKRAYISFILFFIVLYFCTSASYITMTCNNREYMLRHFTCKNYPSAWPFRQPSITLFFALSAESEYFIAYSIQCFYYFRSFCESSKVSFSVVTC